MSGLKNTKGVSADKCHEAILGLGDSMDVWGGKWKLLILIYLSIKADEDVYFMQMLREIPNISAKMLSKELKDLETNRLVERQVHATKPVTVEYRITKYGQSFMPLATGLMKWGLEHRKRVKEGFGLRTNAKP